jgi:methanogenic corrinoid protein MtbC1
MAVASSDGSSQGIKVITTTDWKAALKEAQNDDSFRTFIVDTVKGRAHEIGIGAVNG